MTEIVNAQLYYFQPDQGKRDIILAADDREAQLEAAETFRGVAGAIYRTDTWYRCERLSDGFLRALDADDPR